MDSLNFVVKNNKAEVESFLIDKNYKKIGHKKEDFKGFCVLINKKLFFELSFVENKEIYKTSNISDLKQYCI